MSRYWAAVQALASSSYSEGIEANNRRISLIW